MIVNESITTNFSVRLPEETERVATEAEKRVRALFMELDGMQDEEGTRQKLRESASHFYDLDLYRICRFFSLDDLGSRYRPASLGMRLLLPHYARVVEGWRSLMGSPWKAAGYQVTHPNHVGKKVYLLGTVHFSSRLLQPAAERFYLRKAKKLLSSCKRLCEESDILVLGREVLEGKGIKLIGETHKLLVQELSRGAGNFSGLSSEDISLRTDLGLDYQLRRFAEETGKISVLYWERAESQREMEVADQMRERTRQMQRLQASSLRVAAPGILREVVLTVQVLRATDMLPALQGLPRYGSGDSEHKKKVWDERDEKFTEKLTALFSEEGDSMVAVGAGHVLGQDGMLKRLADRGYQISPLDLTDEAAVEGE